MDIDELQIADHILDKIETKHGVLFEEVWEICLSSMLSVRRGRDGRFVLFGQTEAGRYLMVVLVGGDQNRWRVVTARDMTQSERREYNR